MGLFIYLHYVSAVIALSNTAFIHGGKCQEVIKSNVPFFNATRGSQIFLENIGVMGFLFSLTDLI